MSFGIYVHFGFCASKCPYCDFASVVSKTIDENALGQAYQAELAEYAKRLPQKTVDTIFFGGGTPSLMSPDLIETILRAIRSLWHISETVEISMEANPCSFDLAKLQGFYKAGINRLSIGVQALNDTDLFFLGRKHCALQALEALDNARKVFENISIDLIYARPHQTLENWKNELDQALNLRLPHYSFYQLTLEEGSAFYKKNKNVLPEEDLAVDLFELTDRLTYLAGVPRYEVSNHARKGFECQHNLIYWLGGEWLGIGSAAHGRFQEKGVFYATQNDTNPHHWLKTRTSKQEILTQKERAAEIILMALRTQTGILNARFKEIIGQDPTHFINQDTLLDYQMDGLMVCDSKGIRATAKGLLILDGLVSALLK